MKLVIKTLGRYKDNEIVINGMPNLRELRERVASSLGTTWDMISIKRIVDKNSNNLTSVYIDDPSDINLDDFIKSRKNIEHLNLDELTLYVTFNLGPYRHRRNKLNPLGISAQEGYEMEQLHPTSSDITLFFQNSAINNTNAKNFDERLKEINISFDQIPDRFLDPITNELMNNPVITSDQRTYDLTTLTEIGFVSPFTREKIRVIASNMFLRYEIESFIKQSENEIGMNEAEGRKSSYCILC